MSVANLSRRGFLKGTGLVVGFSLAGAAATRPGVAVDPPSDPTLNDWIRIGTDGAVTLQMAAAEMGQGVYTALPMLLAEELDVDWERVTVQMSPARPAFRRNSFSFPGKVQLTGGSESVRGYWDILRQAGATARAMLVAEAARRWGVSTSECSTEAGHVVCGDKRVGYGELAAAAGKGRTPRATPKDPADFKLLRTSPPRLDLPEKVDGSAIFGIDVVVPGMRNATVVACPHHGGSLVSFDATRAKEVPGVEDVVEVLGAVVVVADTFWHAKKAAGLLDITWDPGEGAGLDDAAIHARMTEALGDAARSFRRGGTPQTDEGTVVAADYAVPYLDHAPIEPMVATAHVQPDRVDVWAPTQVQNRVWVRAAKATGVSRDDVHVHSTYLGGGFGRKSYSDFTDYAVETSLIVGKPVKLTYTREETFAHGHYRPAMLCRHRAKLGPDGLPTDWHITVASQNILDDYLPPGLHNLPVVAETVHGGLSHAPYAVERMQVDYGHVKLPIPVGWWRSVHGSHNGFLREGFLDECAHAAGRDPIEYRRALLAERPRELAVFDLAVQEAGEVPEGLSRGVAMFESFGSIAAHVVDLEVVRGEVFVRRVTCAVDCGLTVHHGIIDQQMSGATIMGISAALFGGLSFKDGAVQETNFHQYELLTMRQAPRVSVHIVPSTEAPGGVGEVGLPPVAGALVNAIFAATGKRIRALPVGDQLRS